MSNSTPNSSATVASAAPLRRKQPTPLDLTNSPSVHLLSAAEQTLCSSLRILPKPYLALKDTLIRECTKKGGRLRKREARNLLRIDVNKTSRLWDFWLEGGYLQISEDYLTMPTTAAVAPRKRIKKVDTATTSAFSLVEPPQEVLPVRFRTHTRTSWPMIRT